MIVSYGARGGICLCLCEPSDRPSTLDADNSHLLTMIGQVEIKETTTLSAIAYKTGLFPSAVTKSGLQSIRAHAPIFTPVERLGCRSRRCNVSVSCPTRDVAVYYRMFEVSREVAASCNRSLPWSVYTGTLEAGPEESIVAFASRGGMLDRCAQVCLCRCCEARVYASQEFNGMHVRSRGGV